MEFKTKECCSEKKGSCLGGSLPIIAPLQTQYSPFSRWTLLQPHLALVLSLAPSTKGLTRSSVPQVIGLPTLVSAVNPKAAQNSALAPQLQSRSNSTHLETHQNICLSLSPEAGPATYRSNPVINLQPLLAVVWGGPACLGNGQEVCPFMHPEIGLQTSESQLQTMK